MYLKHFFLPTIQYNTIQYDTIQYIAMQCNAMQYNTIHCDAMQCNTIQYNTIHCNAMQCNAIQYNTIQYNTIHCNAMQCNAMQCNAIQYNTIQIFLRIDQSRCKKGRKMFFFRQLRFFTRRHFQNVKIYRFRNLPTKKCAGFVCLSVTLSPFSKFAGIVRTQSRILKSVETLNVLYPSNVERKVERGFERHFGRHLASKSLTSS